MLILAILLQFVGALTTLTTLVFLLAGSPNSTPKQLRAIKWMLRGSALVGLTSLVGGVTAMVNQQNKAACLFGLLPIVACIGLFVWLFLRGAPVPDRDKKDDGW